MDEPPSLTFGQLLKELREEARLTQEELADASGVSARTISDLERGFTRSARKDTARLLAEALRLTGGLRAEFEAAASSRGQRGAPARGTRIGGAAAATRTLPRDIGSFTGRGPELKQLLAMIATAVESGGVVSIYSIGGMAGVGKTAFAVHAAHCLADQFPDGQIFLPLHGHTPGQRPVNPTDALASLLLTAGVGVQQIPPGLEPRMQLWRDYLAGKRVLLLLDDAVGHEQVTPLLPGTAGSVVLITSRRHLTALEDTHAISLDTLPPSEAARLLVRLADRPELDPSDPAVREVCRLSGHLPLAIAMLAAQLSHHPAWSIARLAADLGRAREQLEPLELMRAEDLSVAAAFDLSYQDLTPSQQQLFRRLGLYFGLDIDAYAAAALDGIDLSTARRHVDAIYNLYLLSEPAPGRYLFHDLIREHARTLAVADPPGERDAAINRLLDYFLHTARTASRQLRGEVPVTSHGMVVIPPANPRDLAGRQDALEWLEAEQRNLYAAVGYSATHDRRGYAIAIPASLHPFLRSYGHWDQALVLHHTALKAARLSGDQHAEANALDNLGEIQRLAADRPGATASLARALELYRALGDQGGEANALTHLGRVQQLMDDYPGAIKSLGRALELYRGLGDQSGEANARYELGIVERLTDKWSAAEVNLTQALELYRFLRDLEGEARALSELGILQYQTDNYPAADARVQEALRLHRRLTNRNGEANSLRDLGVVQCLTGDLESAAASQKLALKLYQAIGSRLGEANANYELGIVWRQMGDLPAARASLNRAMELYRSFGDTLGEANTLTDLGVVQRMAGDYQAGVEGVTWALETYRAIGDGLGEAEALNNLGELQLAANQFSEAEAYHKQALEMARSIEKPLEEARALEGLGRCQLQHGQSEQSALFLGQALAIYERLGSTNARRLHTLLQDHGL